MPNFLFVWGNTGNSVYLPLAKVMEMTRVLNISLEELSSQNISDLKAAFGNAAEVEIRLREDSPADQLFSEAEFWELIDRIAWSCKRPEEKVAPLVKALADMPVSSICLFADRLSKCLHDLDTRAHAMAYAANEPEGFISADDFLYARCAVVAEGKAYYEKVREDPSLMPDEIVFEPLLYAADDAFEIKMGTAFNYRPAYPYETGANEAGWKAKA
jgi:hypothetical protein